MSIIAAITTPFGEGGVAIIRISGAGVFSVLKNNIGLINIEEKGKNTINFAHFLDDDGSKIDEILVSKFIKPNSYTGEDTLEINCHGGIYVTNKILKTILKYALNYLYMSSKIRTRNTRYLSTKSRGATLNVKDRAVNIINIYIRKVKYRKCTPLRIFFKIAE